MDTSLVAGQVAWVVTVHAQLGFASSSLFLLDTLIFAFAGGEGSGEERGSMGRIRNTGGKLYPSV